VTPAAAGWIVVGVCCVAALAVVVAGAFPLLRAQRALKAKLLPLKERQRRTFDGTRLDAALARIANDAQTARELVPRARRALSTIAGAVRYVVVAGRIVKLLR